MEQIIITNFPMPPSENQIYANNYRNGRRGRRKTKTAYAFERACENWHWQNFTSVTMMKRTLKEWLAEKYVFDVTLNLVFPYEDIFTKEGLPKKNDSSNRVKIFNDRLGKILEVDDKYFWRSTAEKFLGIERRCLIEIKPIKAKKISDLEDILNT